MFKKARFILIGLGALCAAPLLWSAVAEAAYVSCALTNVGSTGLLSTSYPNTFTYSLQCNGEALNIVAQARTLSDASGIQLRIRSETATYPNAYAFGYDASQNLIPGCLASDTTAGTTWTTDSCSSVVKYLTMVVNAE